MPKFSTAIALGLSFWVLLPPAAYAYLDPGTGSFIIQFLASAVIAGLAFVKLYWQKLGLPGFKKKKEPIHYESDSNSEDQEK